MSDDGADLGITAEDALSVVVGGEKQEDKKTRTPAELRAVIEAATDADLDSYGGCGNRAAGLVLEFMGRHPEAATMPADSEHDWPKRADGSTDWDATPTLKTMGVWEYMKQEEPDWFKAHDNTWDELTGFLWGWAVNAARYCLALPPVPNPAIFTISVQ